MKDPRSAYYYACRRTLSSIVFAVFDNSSDNEDESLVTWQWQEINPYMIEMGEKLTDELAASLESPLIVIPTPEDVQEFHAFLSAVVKSISDNVGEPIKMHDGAVAQISHHLRPLHHLFHQLLVKMDSCFRRAELDLSRSEGGDNVLDEVGDAYFLLIQGLSDISKVFDGL